MEIKLSPFFAKLILRFNRFRKVFVMCKGYSEDYENFTELVWEDDKYLEFSNKKTYPEFNPWIM